VLLPELAQDLAAYRRAQPPRTELVIPRDDGDPSRAHDYRTWHRRAGAPREEGKRRGQDGPFTRAPGDRLPAADAVRPAAHFASLLFRDGSYTHAEIAPMLGHSLQTELSVYVHVIEDLRGADRIPANEQIRRAARIAERPPDDRARSLPRFGWSPARGPGLRAEPHNSSPQDPPTSTAKRSANTSIARHDGKPSVGLEPTTPSLPWKCSTS
jgi:hypothetical protein